MIVFYIKKNDWRKQVRFIDKDKFDEDTMDLFDIDEEELSHINDEFSRCSTWIHVYKKDDPDFKSLLIKKSEFDPRIMKVIWKSKEEIRQAEINIKDMLKNKECPGMHVAVTETSMFHKGKLDEGAMENLLDTGLDSAKKRAVKTSKERGHAYNKNYKNRWIRRKNTNGRRKRTYAGGFGAKK
jgi:hypothetical protein